MKDEELNEPLTFQPLAAPTAKVLLRILAEPRERLCEGDISNAFQDMQAVNRNEPAKSRSGGRRR